MALKILAVDDSSVMRKIMQMTFAGEDAEVTTAASGDEALNLAMALKPDVVFADASMSSMDGYALASALKSDPAYGSPAVLIMASQHVPYDEGKGASSGADGHVSKPFDSQAVLDQVAALKSRTGGGPVQARSSAATGARSLKRTMAFGMQAPVPPRPTPSTTSSTTSSTTPSTTPAVPPAAPARPKPTLELADDEPIIELSRPAPTKRASVPAVPAAPVAPVAPAVPPPTSARSIAQPAPAFAAKLEEETPASKPSSIAAAASTPAPGFSPQFTAKLEGLGLTQTQLEGVLLLSREVVEQAVWEVVPVLAETLIREEIKRLMAE